MEQIIIKILYPAVIELLLKNVFQIFRILKIPYRKLSLG